MSWQDIPGWFDFGDIYTEALLNAPKNGVLVEVGVAFGKSFAYLLEEAHRQNRDDLSIYGVDLFLVEDWMARDCGEITGGKKLGESFVDIFESHLEKHVSAEARALIASIHCVGSSIGATFFDDQTVDFVFIDGDHNYEGIKADIPAWLPKVKNGGVIAGHDYAGFEGVRRAVTEAFGPTGFVQRGSSWWKKVER